VKRLAAAWFAAVCLASAAASPETCVPCHRTQTQRFAASGMARALSTGKDSALLARHPQLLGQIGRFSYATDLWGNAPVLTVVDQQEKKVEHAPIQWVFGGGSVGQTFVFERGGRWYESLVSYYATLKKLDVTMGAQNFVPHNLQEASGRLMGAAEVAQCFDCHATGVLKTPALSLASMREGVQCERCHGASETHLARRAPMRKLGALTSEETSEFCGQCHRTWSQIASGGPRGIQNIRFQPYRLAISKCFDAVDRRIGCTACHDPHSELETSAAVYDSKCTACHTAADSKPVCKVATKGCVTCHMPRLELPGAHRAFTDHKIRVVRPGEAYPD